jgi:hypothetical protein
LLLVPLFNFAYQLENVIYSPQGKWGLMYSFENYGILAGVEKFMGKICQTFPSIDQQILEFLNYIRECIDIHGQEKVVITWLGSFLQNVYGSDRAKIMLKESRLASYTSVE